MPNVDKAATHRMVHNSYLCSPHVEGCDCPSEDGYLCNPYFQAGYCPSEGEGEECKAELVPVNPRTGHCRPWENCKPSSPRRRRG
mgnify:CR=1 FL=1